MRIIICKASAAAMTSTADFWRPGDPLFTVTPGDVGDFTYRGHAHASQEEIGAAMELLEQAVDQWKADQPAVQKLARKKRP